MEGVKADRASKQLHEDPLYNLDGIILTLSTLKKETETIFNRPPPKPEEPPAAEKDANMKEENAAEGEKKPADGAAGATEENKAADADMKNEEGTTE